MWWLVALWIGIGILTGPWILKDGWLSMLADSRNTTRTWMALPALVLCWIFWPVGGWLSRTLFLLSLIRFEK